MNQIELLEHALGNLKADKPIHHGLLYMGAPSQASTLVALMHSYPEAYTLAPRTHKVNGFDVPAPEVEELKLDTTYFISNIEDEGFYYSYVWEGDVYDRRYLERGIIHLKTKAAIANAKAMLGIDPEAEIEE